jgi:hypothetical protein
MRFHVLDGVVGSEAETWFEPVGEPKLGDAPRCPLCGAWVGMKQQLPPYVLKLRVFGHIVGDIAFDMASGDLLVSQRFLKAWRAAGLRGLAGAEEVELRGLGGSKRASRVGPYLLVRPERTGVTIDRSRSCVVREGQTTCDLCGGTSIVHAVLALAIDEGTWAGEDIFLPWGINGLTVVTDRVLTVAAEHGLNNVTALPIEAYRWEE